MTSKINFSDIPTERYGLALYELAKETSEIDKIEMEAKNIMELLQKNSDFKNMVTNPTNKKEEQTGAIKSITEKFKFSVTFTKFLCLLCFKRRLFFLERILISFLKIISKSRGEIDAELLSSKKIEPNELENIQKELSENFTSKIKLNYKHDPSLIGGLVIKLGSIMIDTSIKNKLKRLKIKMIEA